MSATRPREAGFTMIEVMIALLLTAIAIVGIMSLYMSQTRASAYSRHTTEATVLAQDGLERLRSQGVPASATITTVIEHARELDRLKREHHVGWVFRVLHLLAGRHYAVALADHFVARVHRCHKRARSPRAGQGVLA